MNSAGVRETTKRVAEFIADTGYDQIPTVALSIAKNAILDCLGCAMAGASEPAAKILTEYAKELGGKPEAGVIAQGMKTSAPLAALINGTMGHVLDYDDDTDGHSWMGHPTVVLMPVLLALGERNQLSGKDILEAYVVGYEVGGKIAEGLTRDHYEGGWHTTATAGVMGATAAAAKLLKLDVPRIRMALGIAASLAGGMRQNFGTMTKSFHAGTAARNGIFAASLAAKGYTAAENVLEADIGYLHVLSPGHFNLDKITGHLGSPFDIISPGLSFKPYPCCQRMNRSIDSVLYLAREHDIKPADVARVECMADQPTVQLLAQHRPKTVLEAKFSMEYCLAVALLDGDVKLPQMSEERVTQRDIQDFLQKVTYVPPESEKDWIDRQQIKVILKDGREFTNEFAEAKGDPGNPLTPEELADKFRGCAVNTLSDKEMEQCIELVANLESLKNINEIMDMVTGVKAIV
jgi:2-methylcitrate dehydratase PrpD